MYAKAKRVVNLSLLCRYMIKLIRNVYRTEIYNTIYAKLKGLKRKDTVAITHDKLSPYERLYFYPYKFLFFD